MNNDILLCARIEALKLTANSDSIKQAITGFVVVGQLDIAQSKLHAHFLRKKLQVEDITLKPHIHRSWLPVSMVLVTGRRRLSG